MALMLFLVALRAAAKRVLRGQAWLNRCRVGTEDGEVRVGVDLPGATLPFLYAVNFSIGPSRTASGGEGSRMSFCRPPALAFV